MKKLLLALITINLFFSPLGLAIPVALATTPPTINRFTATPAEFRQGEDVILEWSTSNTDGGVYITNVGGMAANSSLRITRPEANTYTLYASNRYGQVTKTVSIKPKPCIYTVTAPDVFNVSSKYETYYFDVSTDSGCGWSIDSRGTVLYNTQWLVVPSGGTGSQRVGFTVMQNTNGYSREATLTIAGKTIKVIQEDGILDADFTVDKTSIRPGEVATLSWNIRNAQIMRIDPLIGSVGAKGGYEARPVNTTTYTLFAQSSTGAKITKTVTVNVAPCEYEISTPVAEIPQSGTAGSIRVTTTSLCEWAVSKTGGVDWFNVSQGMGGTNRGNGDVIYNVPENTTTNDRSATLRIAGKDFSFVQRPASLPTITVKADRPVAYGGAPVEISWESQNAVAVSDKIGNANLGVKGTWFQTPTATTTYTLYATNAAGTSASASVTVGVAECLYTVSPTTINVPVTGGTASVTVTANDSTCAWKSVTDQNWVTTASGVGSKTVVFTAAESDSNAARTAVVTVAGAKVTLNQAAPTNLIYGLTKAQAEKLYATLTKIPDTYNPISNASYTSDALGLPPTSPRYAFLQPGLTYECLAKSLGSNSSNYVTYDQLGAALGKPATMQVVQAAPQKAIFKYGLTKAELDSIYQSLKAGKEKPYIRAGATGTYVGGFQEEFSPLNQLACNGMVRLPKQGNMGSNPNYGYLRLGWSEEVAGTFGWYDVYPDDYRKQMQIPHYFLAPTYVAGLVSGAGIGVEGQPQTVVFAPSEIFAAVPFVTLEKDLGYEPSGAKTEGLYDDTPYIRTEQPQVATTTTSTATTTTSVATTTPVTTTASAPTVTLTTLYSQTQEDTHSNFNWNGASDIYGWPWIPSVTGTPKEITLKARSVTGKPTGNVCLAELSGTTPIILGCSTDVAFVGGDNVIALDVPATVTAGKMYFVKFTRTSDANNYPIFTYKYPGQMPLYRATAANSQPMTMWFTGDMAMIVKGTVQAASAPAPTTTTTTITTTTTTATPTTTAETLVKLYEQQNKTTNSNFNWNAPEDRYAWQWTPTVSGTPKQLSIVVDGVHGTPTGSFCVKAHQSKASASYGCATNVTLKSGTNVIPLSGGSTVGAGLNYYVHFVRTSDVNNYPAFAYTSGAQPLYRSVSSGGEADTLWFNGLMAMTIEGVAAPVTASTTTSPAPVTGLVTLTDLILAGYLSTSTPAADNLPSLQDLNNHGTTVYFTYDGVKMIGTVKPEAALTVETLIAKAKEGIIFTKELGINIVAQVVEDGRVCLENGSIQQCLSTCGLVDISGPIATACDLANGVIYLFHGEVLEAGASLFAVIPFLGSVGKVGTKAIVKTTTEAAQQLAKHADEAVISAAKTLLGLADSSKVVSVLKSLGVNGDLAVSAQKRLSSIKTEAGYAKELLELQKVSHSLNEAKTMVQNGEALLSVNKQIVEAAPGKLLAKMPESIQSFIKEMDSLEWAKNKPDFQSVSTFANKDGYLPGKGPLEYYSEWDVRPLETDVLRGSERLVRGMGGELYYTATHYDEAATMNFLRLR